MMHAPSGYDCPFCRAIRRLNTPASAEDAIVLEEERVIALIPLHFWGETKGNCLIIPKQHVENLYALDPDLGVDLIRVTQRLAAAMKAALGCAGISTRQHNEPAGDQDVWHFHLHVFPRFPGDNLYGAPKLRYDDAERRALAARLQLALPANG